MSWPTPTYPKQCSLCGEVKPIEGFNRHRTIQNPERRHSQCAECSRKRLKAWGESNPERKAAAYKEWRKANPAAQRAKETRYSKRHPERRKAKDAKWQKANPEKVAEYNHRRRARQLAAGPSFTAAEWKALLDISGNKCLRCGSKERLQPDHVIPISVGGSNSILNIQPLCSSCNQSKGARTADYR